MFTGIVEATGTVEKVQRSGKNRSFWVKSPLSQGLKVDQSLLHNGICLTIEALENGMHKVTAVDETISKTNAGEWHEGTVINLERSLSLGSLLDGHLVQGHVDCRGTCLSVSEQGGSWLYRFGFPREFAELVIEKGSICLNGISLTVFDISTDAFNVAIIPYTYLHTNINALQPGSSVNLEFDVIGKYIARKNFLSQN